MAQKLDKPDGKKKDPFLLNSEALALPVKKALEGASFEITSVISKPQKRRPQPPFATSTLQMDASRKLGFAASRTMQVAQKLYEGIALGSETAGLITYMRTDGVTIVPEAIDEARKAIKERYGDEYHPAEHRVYKTKAKNAQEAHEAIRPTSFSRHPDDIAKYLDKDQIRLYTLIWRRAIASQMSDAVFDRTSVDIAAMGGDNKPYGLRASGQVLRFDGFLTLYREGREDDDAKAIMMMIAACRSCANTKNLWLKKSMLISISPSHPRVFLKRHSLKRWKSSALAALPLTLQRWLCCKAAIMYASTKRSSSPRIKDGW